MGDTRTITKISTLGRAHTNEFVTEFIVQFSDDGELWRSYISTGGEIKVKSTFGLNNMNIFYMKAKITQ